MDLEKITAGVALRKLMNFEVKEVGAPEERVLQFVGSDETADRDNDIIEVAGWDLKNYKKNPVILFGHDYRSPAVAKAQKVEKNLEKKQLVFDVKFPTIDELSSDVLNVSEHAKFVDTLYNLYKLGYMKATSVGFMPKRWTRRDDGDQAEKPEYQRGVRFMEQELLELSLVPVPANPSALELAKSKGLDVAAVEQRVGELPGAGDVVEAGAAGEAIPAVIVATRTVEFWQCPYCGQEIGEKELFWDTKTNLYYHRLCMDKGPIALPESKNERLLGAEAKQTKGASEGGAEPPVAEPPVTEALVARLEAAVERLCAANNAGNDGGNNAGDDGVEELTLELADDPAGGGVVLDAAGEAESEETVEVETLKTLVKETLGKELRQLKDLVTSRLGRVS